MFGFTRLVLGFILCFAVTANAMTVIRDAEIEKILYDWSKPIFAQAGLDPEAVEIIIVRNPQLNAYVRGGQRMYFHTGLLIEADSASQIQGVVAHEVGHIAGGHLSRLYGQAETAQSTMLVSYLLGIAAAAASQDAGAGAAVISAGSQLANTSFFSFTRAQERSADQAAAQYMQSLGIPKQGLLEFLEKLQRQESWRGVRRNQALSTHPALSERVEFLKQSIAQSPVQVNATALAKTNLELNQLQGKLIGFLHPPAKTLKRFKDDTSLKAQYARAIAYYRMAEFSKAGALVDKLMQQSQNDAYFLELKGQMALEYADADTAVEYYKQALRQAPNANGIRFGLAKSLLALGDDNAQNARAAVQHLKRVLQNDNIPSVWVYLGQAYGRLNNIGMAELSYAERAYLRRDTRDLTLRLRRAKDLIKEGDEGWLRLQDLQIALERLSEDDE